MSWKPLNGRENACIRTRSLIWDFPAEKIACTFCTPAGKRSLHLRESNIRLRTSFSSFPFSFSAVTLSLPTRSESTQPMSRRYTLSFSPREKFPPSEISWSLRNLERKEERTNERTDRQYSVFDGQVANFKWTVLNQLVRHKWVKKYSHINSISCQ